MKKQIGNVWILIACIFHLSSCKYDTDDVPSPKNPNENELITTLKLVFTEGGNHSNTTQAMFQDIDGEGGAPPVIDTIKLAPGKKYSVEIFLQDATKNPVYDVTPEIKNEGHSHQFFFSASDGNDVSFSYADKDKHGVPVGLLSVWTTVSPSPDKTGKIRVILKHQVMDKPLSGNGDITIGTTDIDVQFPVLIH